MRTKRMMFRDPLDELVAVMCEPDFDPALEDHAFNVLRFFARCRRRDAAVRLESSKVQYFGGAAPPAESVKKSQAFPPGLLDATTKAIS